jgi:hypothetical protein
MIGLARPALVLRLAIAAGSCGQGKILKGGDVHDGDAGDLLVLSRIRGACRPHDQGTPPDHDQIRMVTQV